MGVLRGGPGNSRSEIALYNQTVVVTYGAHRPVGPTGLYMYCTSLPVGLSTDPVI
jgi:hypothetical protein